jgi:triacylglycerol lipase
MSDPIVLVHGIFGFGQLTVGGTTVASYFRDIADALRKDAYVVPDPPLLDPSGRVSERAGDLKRYLENPANVEVFGKRVHVVAHSMGGLDARYMISKLAMAERVLSLTTIGTPHHGSAIADLVVNGTDPKLVAFIEYLNVKAIGDLTTSACAQFNRDCPEAPEVRYYCVAGHFEPGRVLSVPLGILGLSHDLIQKEDGDNDGLVSVNSATFGSDAAKWELLGNWEADHFRLINWGTDIVLTPFELMDKTIVENYRAIIARVVQDQKSG